MTQEQQDWLDAHPGYQRVGPPRPGVRFRDCGTLYPDGSFDPMAPMKVARLVAGPPYAICVGVAVVGEVAAGGEK